MQIDNFPFANLDELETAVRLATEAAIYHKADPETVYVNGRLSARQRVSDRWIRIVERRMNYVRNRISIILIRG